MIATILLLWPRWSVLGALLACGVMSEAILSHLAIFGIIVKDDGGTLLILACTVCISTAVPILDGLRNIPVVGKFF